MKYSLVVSLSLLAIVVVMLAISLTYPYKAKLFPWIVGIPLGAMLMVQIVKELLERNQYGPQKIERELLRSYVFNLGWIAAFLVMIYFIGILIAIALFMFLYFKLHGERWALSIAVSSGVTGFLYISFAYLLKIPLYRGVLFS